ncbi:MAG: sulfatase-like hydrolase/transferase, partial [Bryobacteraceae bacterium]
TRGRCRYDYCSMPSISRRNFTTLASCALLGAARGRAAGEKPNIVLITGDHLRSNHVAANGNPAILTPRMDSLAAEGANFTLCTTVGVACAPNRASLMTGRYPNAHGIISNGMEMPLSEVTLTHVLRDAGYYTGQMGKLHFWPHAVRNHREAHPSYGFHQMRLSDEPGCYDDAYGLWLDAQGPEVRNKARVTMPGKRKQFEYYTFAGDEKTTHAHWVASETTRFIQENKGRPFFVHAGFYAPHPPLNAPASMLALYKDAKLPPRMYRDDEAKYLPPVMRKAVTNQAAVPEDTWTEYRRHFYAMVSELDRNIGRIVDAVEAAGLLDRTIFVVTADHGDYLGDHNMHNKGPMPYDGAMRIPLIFSGPGVPRGTTSGEVCEVTDVMPTLLELTGLPLPKGNQGVSLVSAMRGGKTRDAAIMQSTGNRILRTKSAKYCCWTDGQEVLFDLEKDPNELRNVAQEASAKPLLDQMRVRLLRRGIEIQDPLPEKVAPY